MMPTAALQNRRNIFPEQTNRMTLKSGGTGGQACAACKHQRRRCAPDCLLAPFFPGDQPNVFQSVHRLFGVKHVQNLLKGLRTPGERAVAVESIKFHAAMRDKYPVYGCLVEIRHLMYQIQIAKEELRLVLRQLAHHRRQESMLLQVQLGNEGEGGGGVLIDADDSVVDSNWDSKEHVKIGTDIDSSLFIDQTQSTFQETSRAAFRGLHPFFNYKECDSSLESALMEDSIQQMEENELKSAAACFSLTSVN